MAGFRCVEIIETVDRAPSVAAAFTQGLYASRTMLRPMRQVGTKILLAIAHGNRWKVVPVVGALMLSSVVLIVTWPRVTAGYAVALVMYAAAAAIFVNVSWRHWPARVFALPAELAGFRRRLRIQAWAMFGLVALAFVIALSVSVGARS